MTDSDKHSSLQRYGNNYVRKKFYSAWPRMKCFIKLRPGSDFRHPESSAESVSVGFLRQRMGQRIRRGQNGGVAATDEGSPGTNAIKLFTSAF